MSLVNLLLKKTAFSKLHLIKTSKEKDLIQKEIIKLRKQDYIETAETQTPVLILICFQTEIILVK